MNRINYLMNGLAALAFIVLFSQCAGKADNQVATTPASANAELSGMKIAYVEIDTLLAKYNRLAKMEQDLQELSNKLQNGLMEDNNANSLLFRDSINAFLKEYNKTRGYSLIFSNTGFDNLLYADSAYNITKEIVDGLNARYSSAKKQKSSFLGPWVS